ncbi:hypothetical protein M5689_009563 [Euphorbia peplus]|nr:hypothetical protein M5689_009563 [Euphorbia peplus]
MSAANQQSLRININGRANKFQFKFKATKTHPSFKFSLFLKLHQFLLHFNTAQSLKQPSKFLKLFPKFNVRRVIPAVLRNPQRKHIEYSKIEERNSLAGNLASLSKSITEKDQKGIIIHGSSMLVLLLGRCLNKARKIVFIMILFATVIMALDKFINHGKNCHHVFQHSWKAWRYVTSSGFLYLISQVIGSRFCQHQQA